MVEWMGIRGVLRCRRVDLQHYSYVLEIGLPAGFELTGPLRDGSREKIFPYQVYQIEEMTAMTLYLRHEQGHKALAMFHFLCFANEVWEPSVQAGGADPLSRLPLTVVGPQDDESPVSPPPVTPPVPGNAGQDVAAKLALYQRLLSAYDYHLPPGSNTVANLMQSDLHALFGEAFDLASTLLHLACLYPDLEREQGLIEYVQRCSQIGRHLVEASSGRAASEEGAGPQARKARAAP